MRVTLFATAAAALLITGAAQAGETTVTQKAKQFDTKSVTISKGDTIKFVNADSIGHNIHSRSKADKFDLGLQKPGTETSRVFAKDGTFKVRCVIHPKMKLVVKVQ